MSDLAAEVWEVVKAAGCLLLGFTLVVAAGAFALGYWWGT